jgi:nitrate/nitrite-specific signal transduction histidine kinase
MNSIRTKIILFTLLPLTVTLILIGYLAILNKQQSEQDLVINRLSSYRTLLESGDLSFESLKDSKKLEVLLNEKVEYAEILKKDHTVLYSTEQRPSEVHNETLITAIDEAFLGTESTLGILEGDASILVYVSPLIINNKIVGVLRVSLLNEQTNARVYQFAIFVIVIVLASMLVCYFLIAVLLTQTVLNNIDKLKSAATLLEHGDLDTPIVKTSKDEIGELAETLNKMRKEVKESRKDLEQANKDLEQLVNKRTQELQDKLEELERLNRFMIDREIKMVELKKELAALQSKLG